MRTPNLCFIVIALLLGACGLETEPNPNYQSASGGTGGRDGGDHDGGGSGGSSGTSGGTGGRDAGGTGGTTGGAGGDAGPADCTRDAECPATRPQCNPAGECVTCTSSAACEGRDALPYCKTSRGPQRGECVACLEDDHCEGSSAGSYCLDNACVPCKIHADCTDLEKPQCGDDGQCRGCTDNDACEGRTGTEACVTAAGPNRGHCVGCIDHADCSNPTPQCTNNECKPCSSNAACADRTGTTVCDTSDRDDLGGTCVQCTASSYAACGTSGGTPYVCNVLTDTCTTSLAGSAQPCQPCVADDQCRSGTICMRTRFGEADTGYHCLWRQDADGAGAPNGDCLNVRPYVGTESTWLSIEGDDPTVCKPARTTCKAQNEFLNTSCTGPTTEGHAQCGVENVADAYCAPFNSGHFCTIPCVSFLDCKNTRPGDDMECQSQMLGSESVDVCVFQ